MNRYSNYSNYNMMAFIGSLFGIVFSALVGIMAWSAMKGGIMGVFLGVFLFALFAVSNISAFTAFRRNDLPVAVKIYAAIVVCMCLSVEVLATWHELGGGVQAKLANAAHVEQSMQNSTALAQANAQTAAAIADCNKRFPRAKRDKAARDACLKPLNNLASVDQKDEQFIASHQAEFNMWQSIADWYNAEKIPEDKVTVDQIITAMMMYIGISAFLCVGFLTLLHVPAGDDGYEVVANPTPRRRETGHVPAHYGPPSSGLASTSVGYLGSLATGSAFAPAARKPLATRVAEGIANEFIAANEIRERNLQRVQDFLSPTPTNTPIAVVESPTLPEITPEPALIDLPGQVGQGSLVGAGSEAGQVSTASDQELTELKAQLAAAQAAQVEALKQRERALNLMKQRDQQARAEKQKAEAAAQAAREAKARADKEEAARLAMEDKQRQVEAAAQAEKAAKQEAERQARLAKEMADRKEQERLAALKQAEEERAERERLEREQEAREAAAKAAEAERVAKEQAEAERQARLGCLTDEQVDLAADIIRQAVGVGNLSSLGRDAVKPLFDAAKEQLPGNKDLRDRLRDLACEKLAGEGGLVAFNPKFAAGKPKYIVVA